MSPNSINTGNIWSKHQPQVAALISMWAFPEFTGLMYNVSVSSAPDTDTFIFSCCLFRGSMCRWKVLVSNLRSRHSALRPAGYEQSVYVCMCFNRSHCCYQPSHLVGNSDVVLPAGLHVFLTHDVFSFLCLLLGHLVFTGLTITSASSFTHDWQMMQQSI